MTYTVCYHLYVKSKKKIKQMNEYKKMETDSQI